MQGLNIDVSIPANLQTDNILLPPVLLALSWKHSSVVHTAFRLWFEVFFFFKHLLWGNYRFTGSCKGSVCVLFSVTSNPYILHNYSTLSKPGHCLHWYSCVWRVLCHFTHVYMFMKIPLQSRNKMIPSSKVSYLLPYFHLPSPPSNPFSSLQLYDFKNVI